MKIVAFELTPSGGSITVKGDGKRYKKGGWGRNPMETAPLYDLRRLLQSAGLKVRKLKNQDPCREAYSLGIGGRGLVTSAEIYHADNYRFSAGEVLNERKNARFDITPGWEGKERMDWRDIIPAADLEALKNALTALLGPQGAHDAAHS
ncbi:MAG: hypothetical protein ACRC4O_02285 [Giesbergeria sp.]